MRGGGADKDAILADMLEAVLGAMYIVYGYDRVKTCITDIIYDAIDLLTKTACKSYKSLLQERSQQQGFHLPLYDTTELADANFQAIVTINTSSITGMGIAGNKKKAQELAAQQAYDSIAV